MKERIEERFTSMAHKESKRHEKNKVTRIRIIRNTDPRPGEEIA